MHRKVGKNSADKIVHMVEVLNGLTARDALCLLVGCMLTVLDEAPNNEERQRSLDDCIDLLKGVPPGLMSKRRNLMNTRNSGLRVQFTDPLLNARDSIPGVLRAADLHRPMASR
jgi:hypothetical protein